MDETKVTPEQEVKEGTVGAEIIKESTEVAPQEDSKVPETVPLAAYLELKNDLKELKHQIKESKNTEKTEVKVQGLKELTSKYPDVSEDFIKDMLSSATVEATKKIEEKYSPIIERQEIEKKQAAFDKAFDNLFNKALKENPDLPKNIDKDLIKTLATTPAYINVPVAEILTKMYGSSEPVGRRSSENEARTSADKVADIVSFDKITPEQKKDIMADPKARQKYFDWLDKQPGR